MRGGPMDPPSTSLTLTRARSVMRNPFRRRTAGPTDTRYAARHAEQAVSPSISGTCYRTGSYRPLRPWQVRQQRFPLGRRGYDPIEVARFLDQVAGDLEAAYRQVAESRREADQVKAALRRWRSEQVRENQGRYR